MEQEVERKFSIIIPAYNEGRRFEKVVSEALKIPAASEVVFVDDGSTDDTEESARMFATEKKFVYVRHKKNKGKGAALKTGLKKARNEIVLFLDADLMNITAAKILKIARPVLNDEVDLSRGSFRRKRGRVTEYAVKPMMKILFPDMYFEQPISGQICAKKNFLANINFESKYGVDIGILFDAIEASQRIVEVDIGKLSHKANSEENIAEMSRQVLETMIKKAGLIQHKYKLVVFTLDNTLVQKDTLKLIFHKLHLAKEYDSLRGEFEKQSIDFKEFALKTAELLKGFPSEKVEKICNELPLARYSEQVVAALKKRKYQVAIISSNFSPIVIPLAKRLGVDLYDCIYIEKDANNIIKKISKASMSRWLDEDLEKSFQSAFSGIIRKAKIRSLETIIVANSEKCLPLLGKVGLAVAYKPKDKTLRENANKTISVLPELLAIIE